MAKIEIGWAGPLLGAGWAAFGGMAATQKKKIPAAVALGRLGGLKGGKARAARLSEAERSESARKAAAAPPWAYIH